MIWRLKMILKKLIINNFKSYKDKAEIDFTYPKGNKNIFLIGGMNGSGKTTLMEAINICLYGENNEYLIKCINRKNFKNQIYRMSIELIFYDNEDNVIQVKRSWDFDSNKQISPINYKERFFLFKNKKTVSFENKELWQDLIREYFPESVTQFFFFDGEKIQEIAEDDHSEIRLKSSLEEALGLKLLSKLSEDINGIMIDEKKEMIDVSNEEINFTESKIEKVDSEIKKLTEKKFEIEKYIKELKNKRDNTKKEFKLIFNRDPKIKEKLKKNEKEKLKITNKIGKLEEKVENMISTKLYWALSLPLLNRLKEAIEEEEEDVFENKIKENLFEILNDIKEAYNNPTPLKDEPFTDGDLKILKNRLENIYNNNHQKDNLLNLSKREIAKIIQKIEEVENSDIYSLVEFISEKKNYEERLKEIEMESSFINSKNDEEKFNELQDAIENYQTQIGRQSELIENLEDEIIEKKHELKDLREKLEYYYNIYDKSKNKNTFVEECQKIINVINEFIKIMRRNKIEYLQNKTFEMFKKLSNKSDTIQELKIDKETYEIFIYGKDETEIKKSSLSAGEKEVFSISLLWGLAQTSQLKLPIIIDTPLSRLDSVHRENIVKYYFPNAAEQVIILSTDTEVDKKYYQELGNYVIDSKSLKYDRVNDYTYLDSGYFWN